MKTNVLFTILVLAVSSAFADDAAKLAALLAGAADHGGVVTIPPADYQLDGQTPITLPSHITVSAYGARFHLLKNLPKTLGDRAHVVLFAGENVSDFRWFGGHFTGHVFDNTRSDNSWEPNVNTRAILITTTPEGPTENLIFRDVTSDGLAGAVITVLGASKKGSEREGALKGAPITETRVTQKPTHPQPEAFSLARLTLFSIPWVDAAYF